jgi:HlyD family secretion protein
MIRYSMKYLNPKKIFHFLKTHKKIVFPVIIVIVLLLIFWPKPPKPLETQTIKRGDIIQTLSATGTVAATSVSLSFLSSGKLTYLGVKKGEYVKSGQVLAELDQRIVQKNLETALRNYSEQRNSFDATSDSNQNRTPQQALNDSMKRILQNNQYDLDKAVISVELQDLAKQQAILTSPIDGVVTRADVETAGVNVGATTTFVVSDLKTTTFNIDIDESDVGKVTVGLPAKVTLDAYPDNTFNVKVKSIDFAAHTTTTGENVYTVEVGLPQNNKFAYRVGMNGDADIITNEKKDVVTVPLVSVVDDNYVYVKTKKGAEKRKIKLGLQNDTDGEVKSRLMPGDKVALDPTEAEKVSKK